MSVALTINGTSYNYPELGDSGWGNQATLWATAVTQGMLQKSGGAFTLTADVNFGATFGLVSTYYKSRTVDISLTGLARLAKTDTISWRNNANSADLALGIDGSDVLTFNGEVVPAGLIVNADVDSAAAIAFSKMAALTVSRLIVSDASGVLTVSPVTSTEAGYLSGVSSAIQTQLDARLPLSGGTMTGTLTLSGDPSTAFQAATKSYVDATAAGFQMKTACRVATTANGTLATAFEDGDTIDGVVLATSDRILIKDQSTATENGIYVVQASGAPVRSTDADAFSELVGALVFISAGTANAATTWACNSPSGGTIGVDDINFAQYSANQVYTANGQGVQLSGSEFSLQIDGATLTESGSGVKVGDASIANAQIAAAAAIAVNKLAALTVSRAVASDASGFLVSATTTSTELGYVNGVTSAIQTQLDAKIAASTLTTNGDLLTRTAGVPARIAIGTSGYYLGTDGSAAAWTDPKISFVRYQSSDSALTIPTTWTSFTLPASDLPAGSPWTNSGNVLTAIYTGIHQIIVTLSNVVGAADRKVMIRLRNTTDSTTNAVSTICVVDPSAGRCGMVFTLQANISNVSKSYEMQICCSGSGVVANNETVDSESSKLWRFTIERIRQ